VKGQWEARVGKLLVEPDFVWSFKPPDSPLYGGQPRVDWLACDRWGKFWMIEVKQASADRKSISIKNDVSAGQIRALNAIANGNGVALLAIGQGPALYIHSWRVAWLRYQQSLIGRLHPGTTIQLTGPSLLCQFYWTGPKAWKNLELYEKIMVLGVPRDRMSSFAGALATHQILVLPSEPSPEPTPPVSILRREDYTPMPVRRARKAPSGPSSSE
jgi:hypothetical protein